MGQQPRLQVLASRRLDVEHPAGAEHRHEDLGRGDLAGQPIDEVHLVAGEVDEHPLPGRVLHPQHRVLDAQPALVVVAGLTVAPALGLVLAQLQRLCRLRFYADSGPPANSDGEVQVGIIATTWPPLVRPGPELRNGGRRWDEGGCRSGYEGRWRAMRRTSPPNSMGGGSRR